MPPPLKSKMWHMQTKRKQALLCCTCAAAATPLNTNTSPQYYYNRVCDVVNVARLEVLPLLLTASR